MSKLVDDAKAACARSKPIRASIAGGYWGGEHSLMVLLADGTRICGSVEKVSKLNKEQRKGIRETDPKLTRDLGMKPLKKGKRA